MLWVGVRGRLGGGQLPCTQTVRGPTRKWRMEGFEAFTRRSVTLTVIDTSGVPSALRAEVKRYPVWEGPVATAVQQADAFQSKLEAGCSL